MPNRSERYTEGQWDFWMERYRKEQLFWAHHLVLGTCSSSWPPSPLLCYASKKQLCFWWMPSEFFWTQNTVEGVKMATILSHRKANYFLKKNNLSKASLNQHSADLWGPGYASGARQCDCLVGASGTGWGTCEIWDKQRWQNPLMWARIWGETEKEGLKWWFFDMDHQVPDEARAVWIRWVSSVEHTIADTLFFCLWIFIDPSNWRLSYHLFMHNMFNSLSQFSEMTWFLSWRFISCVEITEITRRFPATIVTSQDRKTRIQPTWLAPRFPGGVGWWRLGLCYPLPGAPRLATCLATGLAGSFDPRWESLGDKLGVFYREGGF